MDETGGQRLSAPGASLFYRTTGSGPVLVFVQGGAGDADGCAPVVEALAARYTVATYDPRGLSRSTVEDPATLTVETHGDDLARLVAHLSSEPVTMVGSSRGAMVALDMISRHPGLVSTLVAHEPPLTQVLSEAEREKASAGQVMVEEIYAKSGPLAAMGAFAKLLELDFQDREPDAPMPAPDPDKAGNLDVFLTHDAPAVRLYRLDLEAVKRGPTRVIPGGGAAKPDLFTFRAAECLADALGVRLELFPGGHAGASTHPGGFARRLLEVLG